MKLFSFLLIGISFLSASYAFAQTQANAANGERQAQWSTDFFDDFDSFDPDNWQDQRLWVNNELQCYLPDNQHNTREVSNGTLKVRMVDLGKEVECDNIDKHGKQHPPTQYVAGRIASKNLQEFVKGKWTARLKLHSNGKPGMFPAWWLLGAQNNEPPVQQDDETVCWPLTGSGEIDIFEHYGAGGADHYTARRIVSEGKCDAGDWKSEMKVIDASLDEYHEYSVEWSEGDLIYRLDGTEVYRNTAQGDAYPEAMFAILNYAKLSSEADQSVAGQDQADAVQAGHDMQKEWVMEVDWVKHEAWR